MTNATCQVCEDQGPHEDLAVREMMAGTRELFRYFLCSNCGALQIHGQVTNLSQIYDNETYSSFSQHEVGALRSHMSTIRDRFGLAGKRTWMGRLLNARYKLARALCIFAQHATRSNLRILDVGCGNGGFLKRLAGAGFENLTGIDPFIDRDLEMPGYSVQKKHLADLAGEFDLVWSHHSFEHMSNPSVQLAHIRRLLKEGGVCLITVPVRGCVFAAYGADSYIIQAPHHNFLFSLKSMEVLSRRCSLPLEDICRDAAGTSNWLKLSALWRRDIASTEMRGALDSYFSKEELHAFLQVERELLAAGEGDNVTFTMRKSL